MSLSFLLLLSFLCSVPCMFIPDDKSNEKGFGVDQVGRAGNWRLYGARTIQLRLASVHDLDEFGLVSPILYDLLFVTHHLVVDTGSRLGSKARKARNLAQVVCHSFEYSKRRREDINVLAELDGKKLLELGTARKIVHVDFDFTILVPASRREYGGSLRSSSTGSGHDPCGGSQFVKQTLGRHFSQLCVKTSQEFEGNTVYWYSAAKEPLVVLLCCLIIGLRDKQGYSSAVAEET
ncbi:hypothetical protein BDN72DRAFT_864270 [Pluteus cervinus]|uniref:Uncharacterized protein n=1 Tax=Pluteus cervinus TaxID=181527 RepID=A0ACD3A5A6_9AGAR|nr:hypothetical protein BDN72DRAFT_864270 [Pluteus cervinus]